MAELLQKVGFKPENGTEVTSPVAGIVTGQLPVWVRGSLYRNGPGMHEFGGRTYEHLFDGMALIQHFCISEEGATYQRRYVQSENRRRSMAANAPVTAQFGTCELPDPCMNIFQRYLTYFTSTSVSDNTQVNVFPFNEGLYTATETLYWNRIDPVTLETEERVSLLAACAVNLATAHPHIDTDGTLFNVGHVFGKGMPTSVLKIPPKTDTSECVGSVPKGGPLCLIDSPWKAHVHYHHSFCMTQNYIVLIYQPLLWNVPKLAFRKFTRDSPCTALKWYPDLMCRFRIIDKTTGNEVHPDRKYEADAFFTFHTVNAYEDNGHVVIDVVCYKDASIVENLYLKNLTSDAIEDTFKRMAKPITRRYVIPLDVNTSDSKTDLVNLEGMKAMCKKTADVTFLCMPDVISDISLEFPQINYNAHNGRKYRYMYGVGIHDDTTGLNSLIKVDMQTGKHILWRESGCYQSEPVFIASPEEPSTGCIDGVGSDNQEDNGVLLSAVNKRHPEGGSECFLLLLDAKSMTEIARVEFPGVTDFPTDFHGSFASEAWTNKASSSDRQ